MTDDELRDLFERLPPPTAREEARQEAVRLARLEWERAGVSRAGIRTPSRTLNFFLFAGVAVAGAAAVALLVLVIGADRPQRMAESAESEIGDPPSDALGGATPSPASKPLKTGYQRERQILQEAGRLFEGRLSFIALKDGKTVLGVADEPVFESLPVVVELSRNGEMWRVISYSGNRVSLRLNGAEIEFDILVNGDGEVILTGPGFAWSSRLAGGIGDVMISAEALSG